VSVARCVRPAAVPRAPLPSDHSHLRLLREDSRSQTLARRKLDIARGMGVRPVRGVSGAFTRAW
jgi:hypothetical protein